MFKDSILGFKTFYLAIGFISKNKLSYFYIFPIALSILFYWLSAEFRQDIYQHINDFLFANLDSIVPIENNGFINKTIDFIIYVLVWIVTFYVWIKINRYAVLILLSPVFSILSEKTEKILTKKDYPFSLKQFFKDILRGSYIAIRNIFLEFGIVGLCFFLSFLFPFLSFITLPTVALVSWYFMGFSFYDYNLERRKLNHHDSNKEIWRRKGLIITQGALFTYLAYVPFLGVVFSPIWATVAAALAANDGEERDSAYLIGS